LNVLQMFAHDDRKQIEERMPRLLTGEAFDGTEYSLIRKDGSLLPVIIYSTRIAREGITEGFRGIVIDIAERKKAENELRIAYEKLQEKHIALREVLDQIEGEKKETRLRIAANIERLVSPILGTLRANASTENNAHLDMLEKNLENVTSPFVRDLERGYSKLTQKEIQVCNMIREGLRSKEIAFNLNISLLTVHKYRQQIRKKFRISNTKANLTSYLKSM